MDKRQLERKLTGSVNGAILMSLLEVERYTGFSRAKVSKLLEGLEVIELDGKRRYFIPDIAERIMERRTT